MERVRNRAEAERLAQSVDKGFLNARRFDWRANARAVLEVYRDAAAWRTSAAPAQP